MPEKAVSEMTDEEIIVHIRSLRQQRDARNAEAAAAKERKVRPSTTPTPKKGDVDDAFNDVIKGLFE